MKRSLLRRCLKAFLLGLAVLVVGVFAFGLYLGRDRKSDFYIVNADLVDDRYLEELDKDPKRNEREHEAFGFFAHRMQAGHGLLLAHRFFSPGSILVIDDEIYEKVTVRIPTAALPTQRLILAAPSQALIVLSSGGSAWPRHDCSGHVAGKIELQPSSSGIEVQIQGQFVPMGISDVAVGECKARDVHFQFSASPLQLRELTPWLGAPGGESPMDATYAD